MAHIKKEITIIKENEITHVEGAKKRAKVDVAREQLKLLECKICKDTPSPPVVLVTCCKQILGCEACFHSHKEKQNCCPLCHDSNYSAITIRRLDEPYALLQKALQS